MAEQGEKDVSLLQDTVQQQEACHDDDIFQVILRKNALTLPKVKYPT